MAFDPDAYLAQFCPDTYLAKHAEASRGAQDRRAIISKRHELMSKKSRRPILPAKETAPSVAMTDVDRAGDGGEEKVPEGANEESSGAAEIQPDQTIDEAIEAKEDRKFWDQEIERLEKLEQLEQQTPTSETIVPANETIHVLTESVQPNPIILMRARDRAKMTSDGRVMPTTMMSKHLMREERVNAIEYPDGIERPRRRGDCVDGPRPCCFVSCRYHLALEITDVGSLKVVFPDRDPTDIPETCSLDVADRGGCTLDDVGRVMNRTRERIRQLESQALERLRQVPEADDLSPGIVEQGDNV